MSAIIETMDFNKTKDAVDPTYLPYIEYLESLEVGKMLVDEKPLSFKYGNLVQNWKLQIGNKDGDFSIICNKKNKEIKIECLSEHPGLFEILVETEQCFFNYLENNYNIRINPNDSVAQYNRMSQYTYYHLEFEEILTVEQLAILYRDMFIERR